MDKPDIELLRLTIKGQYTLPRRIRDYLGVGPDDHVAFVLTDQGVLVKKLIIREERPTRKSPAGALRELVLAIGQEARAHWLSEEDVGQDIDQYLKQPKKRQGK